MSSANTSSMRASIMGSISPMWPMMSFSRGWRSSVAGQHHAQDVDSRLRMPAPAGLFEHAGSTRRQIGVVGQPNRLRCDVRVDVDRHVEVHRRCQQAVIARVIEKAALGDPIDECTDEAKLLHRPYQLGNAGVGALHRQHGKAREPARIAGDGHRQMVVHLSRDGDAVRARHEVGTRTGVGEHLHRDAGLVHGLQASLADLGQHVERVGAIRALCARPEAAPADGAGSMRRTSAGTVKCSSSATTRMVRWPFIAIALEIVEELERRDLLC